jgi:hypothetical protein
VFSGAPTLGVPDAASSASTALEDKAAAGPSLEQLAAPRPAPSTGKLPFKALVLYGAILHGNPVDAEFLTYSLADDTVFLLQQESGPTDNRAVAIMNSVRAVR